MYILYYKSLAMSKVGGFKALELIIIIHTTATNEQLSIIIIVDD